MTHYVTSSYSSFQIQLFGYSQYEERNPFFIAVMLILASQRIESVIGNWMGNVVLSEEHEPAPTKRGAAPTIVEW